MTDSEKTPTGKGRPTPTRKEREAANKRPLVGERSKEARREAREQLNKKRAEARAGLLAGEERFLGPRDKGPQKRFARDFIDSRFSAGELLLPVAFGSVILSTVANDVLVYASMLIMWALMFVMVVNSWWFARTTKKAMAAKFGADNLERGLTSYVIMRSLQMRPMRLPKPQVRRGADIG
jgi:hypothetical protein